MPSTQPIPISEIMKYLPHRPPMVWVDEVLEYSEKAGLCRLRLKADAHYMNGEGLRPSSCLEFIAQAYGFISVCHHIYILDPNSKPLSKAFLASIKSARLPDATTLKALKVGDELRIQIDGVRQLGPIVSFHGRLFHGEEILSEAQMKVFKEYQQ